MPTKPPSDRTPAKGVPPAFNRSLSKFIPARRGFIRSLSAGDPPTTQICETNPISRTGTACRAPISRNEPNPSLPRWPKVSPGAPRNPISAHPASRHPKNAKRTQLPPGQNAKRTQSPPPLSSRASGCGAKRSGPKPRDPLNHHRRRRFLTRHQRHKYAKRTQFKPPIYNLQYTVYNPLPQFPTTNIQSTIYNM